MRYNHYMLKLEASQAIEEFIRMIEDLDEDISGTRYNFHIFHKKWVFRALRA